MGLLDSILPPDDRSVAMKLKDYAVAKSVTQMEREVLTNLQIKEAVFVNERILFLCAFIRDCLIHLGDSQGNNVVMAVRHYYDIYTEEYFQTRPGIDSVKGLQVYQDAKKRYGLSTKEELYPAFLEELKVDKSATLDPVKAFNDAWVSPTQFELFSRLMTFHTGTSIRYLQKQLARIKG